MYLLKDLAGVTQWASLRGRKLAFKIVASLNSRSNLARWAGNKYSLMLLVFSSLIFSFHAGTAQWSTNGTNLYYNGGNVGVGTITPVTKLQIMDDVGGGPPSGTTPAYGLLISGNGTGGALNIGIDATTGFYSWLQSRHRLNGNYYSLALNPLGGNVGIGTSAPDDLLHIGNGGSLRLQQTTNAEGLFSDINFNTYRDTEPDQIGARIRFRTVANIASGYPSVMKTGEIRFNTKWGWDEQTRMLITAYGNVGIGTTDPQNKLDVNGTIHSKEVKVDLTGWPDYVFAKDYQLTPLEEVKSYIDANQHLPEVPSAKEVEKEGVKLGEMNKILLKKMEEMTLYMIKANERIEELETKIQSIESKIN